VFGAGTRIAAAERRLKCSVCGHKGAKTRPVPRLDGYRRLREATPLPLSMSQIQRRCFAPPHLGLA
jgi:hypothetical protein